MNCPLKRLVFVTSALCLYFHQQGFLFQQLHVCADSQLFDLFCLNLDREYSLNKKRQMKIQSQRIKKDLSQKTAKTLPWFSFWSSSTWILKSFRRSREVSAALALLSVVSSVGKSWSYGVISLFVSGESSAVSLPQKLRNTSTRNAPFILTHAF